MLEEDFPQTGNPNVLNDLKMIYNALVTINDIN